MIRTTRLVGCLVAILALARPSAPCVAPSASIEQAAPHPSGPPRNEDLLRQLAVRGLTSVLVEGGAALHGSFLAQALWDELSLFVAPKLAGEGALSWAGFPGAGSMKGALRARIESVDSVTFAPDVLLRARPR